MVQLTGAETSSALEPLYRAFHTDRRPPPNTLVWAASIDGDSWALRSEAVSILGGDPNQPYDAADSPNTLAVTLGLGSLLLQAVMSDQGAWLVPHSLGFWLSI